MKEVTFLLHVFNKEEKIGLILKKIGKKYPESKIIVIDNNSSDKTAKIASKSGAQVLYEKEHGKYNAIKKGFKNIKTQFTVVIDIENVNYLEDVKKLIEKLFLDKTDIALCSQTKRNTGSITKFNLINYYLFHLISSLLYYKTSDVFTGYWAFKRNFIDYILQKEIKSTGFQGESEMFSIISRGNFKIHEIPVKCATDSTNLSLLGDNSKIYKTISGLIKLD